MKKKNLKIMSNFGIIETGKIHLSEDDLLSYKRGVLQFLIKGEENGNI